MVEKGKHRRVENAEDFTEWNWGDPPELVLPSDEIIVEMFKDWASDLSGQAQEKSCASGAAVAFAELAENGFFVLDGITDDGLLFTFQGTDSFTICDELDIVEDALTFDDPRHISGHLRRLADAIDAASPPIAPDEAVPT